MNQALLTLNWNWSAKGAVPFCAVRACELALRNCKVSLARASHSPLAPVVRHHRVLVVRATRALALTRDTAITIRAAPLKRLSACVARNGRSASMVVVVVVVVVVVSFGTILLMPSFARSFSLSATLRELLLLF